mmetsp:Transcript_41022/g.100897  ORF Transcript_41022/g.100897 Transcript_41022/m.100897 type:complete len:184 (-) Transcript_41022:392-943(-)
MHPERDWVAVGGEDCRMSCLEFARDDQHESVLLLSVCINGAVIGLQFTRPQAQIPSLAIMVFELPYIIYYDYHASSGGGLTSVLVKPRTRVVKAALDNRRKRVGDRAKISMVEVDEMNERVHSMRLSQRISARLQTDAMARESTSELGVPFERAESELVPEESVPVSDRRGQFEVAAGGHPAE